MFCGIKSHICSLKPGVQIGSGLNGVHSEGRGDLNSAISRFAFSVAELFTHHFRKVSSLLLRVAGNVYDEFITSELSIYGIGNRFKRIAYYPVNVPQCFVSTWMSVCVIDLLEVVDIEEYEAPV